MRLAFCLHTTFMMLASLSESSADSRPKEYDHGVDLPTRRPLNLAHRGSSGVYPEHTKGAYLQAIQDGADVIECDVTMTEDLQLICSHDNYLSTTTDVASRAEFAGRNVTGYMGRNDWWAANFTLAEIKTLYRRQVYDFRDQSHNEKYRILTLDEFIDIAEDADRPVGIYPEAKEPEFLNTLPALAGRRFEDLLLGVLQRRGYDSPNDACFVQSFSEGSLRYMANKTSLPLVMLTDTDMSDQTIEELATFCYGVGAWKEQIARFWKDDGSGYKNWISEHTDFVRVAHQAGLKVHVYTFRNEDRFLAWDFKQDPVEELDYFMDLEADGLFTDFPETLDRYLDEVYAEPCSGTSCALSVSQLLILLIGIIHLSESAMCFVTAGV